ncbi:hypothetical protein H2200_008815 [Cladophialophora chaetospira]|uniref:Uncharacterized protein n=1 Tax=Cladophialophora chaetospira TaxID=386627 RepID=A0AA39CG19_9EURO|nr:hypothetical protein H2200_008815 [Cladophialophora chaetospira]
MYLESEKPKYPTGFGLSLTFGASGFLIALFLEWTYTLVNARKAKSVDEARAKYTEEELFNMGDKSPLSSMCCEPSDVGGAYAHRARDVSS